MIIKYPVSLRILVADCDDYCIEYRTDTPYEKNVLTGTAKYKDGKLIPIDHDYYSLDDRFDSYSISEKNKTITVWYESKWI